MIPGKHVGLQREIRGDKVNPTTEIRIHTTVPMHARQQPHAVADLEIAETNHALRHEGAYTNDTPK
jgi:hypothetical protein